VYVFYLVKLATHKNAHCDVGRSPYIVTEPESHNFFKSLFQVLAFQPLAEHLHVNFVLCKNFKFT